MNFEQNENNTIDQPAVHFRLDTFTPLSR